VAQVGGKLDSKVPTKEADELRRAGANSPLSTRRPGKAFLVARLHKVRAPRAGLEARRCRKSERSPEELRAPCGR